MMLYMCDGCAEQNEGVGHDTPDHLRVCGDEWLCEGCYDDRTDKDAPRWRTMPKVIPVGWQPLWSHPNTGVFLVGGYVGERWNFGLAYKAHGGDLKSVSGQGIGGQPQFWCPVPLPPQKQ